MKDLLRMIVVLTAICLVAALALSQVYALTEEPIAKAMRLEKLNAIKAVLPPYDNEPDRDETTMKGRTYSIATREGKSVGFAFEVDSPDGYSGQIRALLGVLPDGRISGLEILEHKETPGLGQKIEDASWRDKVVWKDAAHTERRTLANTDWKVVKDGGDIDQISGATISPRAVVAAVRAGLTDYTEAQANLGASQSEPAQATPPLAEPIKEGTP